MPTVFGMKGGGEIPHGFEDIEGFARKDLVVQVIGKQALGNSLYGNTWEGIYKRLSTQGVIPALFFAFQLQNHS